MTKNANFAVSGEKSRKIRNRHRRALISSATASLIVFVGLAAPAAAKPFQQYLNGVCGATAKICKVTFAKVPAGQRLDVSNVSCYLRLAGGSALFYAPIRAVQLLVLGATPSTVVSAVTLATNIAGATDDEIVAASNDSISAFANAQQRFQAYVEISEGSFSQVACHISGNMVKA